MTPSLGVSVRSWSALALQLRLRKVEDRREGILLSYAKARPLGPPSSYASLSI